MDGVLSSSVIVGLNYSSILGFIRLVKNRWVFVAPLAVTEATEYVVGQLAQPNTTIVVPTSRHWPLLRSLLNGSGVSANLTADTRIAALAIEHGFTVFSNDTDFARFDNLGWENPLRGQT